MKSMARNRGAVLAVAAIGVVVLAGCTSGGNAISGGSGDRAAPRNQPWCR